MQFIRQPWQEIHWHRTVSYTHLSAYAAIQKTFKNEEQMWVNQEGDPTVTSTTSWPGISNRVLERSTITNMPFVSSFCVGVGLSLIHIFRPVLRHLRYQQDGAYHADETGYWGFGRRPRYDVWGVPVSYTHLKLQRKSELTKEKIK